MNFNVIIILTVFNAVQNFGWALTSLADSLPATKDVTIKKSCNRDRVYKLLGYDCSSMDLKTIPTNLPSGIEVFDVSYNRIRELNRGSFTRYTNLKYLYLFENMIMSIEEGTFSDLTDLEAIDLSFNGISTIPLELFNLPLLRNVHYADNNLQHLEHDLKQLKKPIKAPLQYINLSGCKLQRIPDFGILPSLVKLNVSFNKLSETTPQQISPLCALQTIDLNATDIPSCKCKILKMYLRKREITILNEIDCPSQAGYYCADSTNSTADGPEYAECKLMVQDKQKAEEFKRTWLSVVGALGAFFVIFMGMLYWLHRRNVKQMSIELKETKLKQIHQTEHGNKEVLLTTK